MSRRLVAASLVVAVQVAAATAPFVHAHPDDHDTGHHAARGVHAHVGGHAHEVDHDDPAGPILDHEGGDRDRAVFLGTFLSQTAAQVRIAAAIPDSIVLAAPPERPAQQALQVVHGHDPPCLCSLPPRAPPSFLS